MGEYYTKTAIKLGQFFAMSTGFNYWQSKNRVDASIGACYRQRLDLGQHSVYYSQRLQT